MYIQGVVECTNYHDFVKDGAHYNADAYADAFQRTAARLKELLGNPNAPNAPNPPAAGQ